MRAQDILSPSDQLRILPVQTSHYVGFAQAEGVSQWIIILPDRRVMQPMSGSDYCVWEGVAGQYTILAITDEGVHTQTVSLGTAGPPPPVPDPDPPPGPAPDRWEDVGRRAQEAGIANPTLKSQVRAAIASLIAPDGPEDLDYAAIMQRLYDAPGGDWVARDLNRFRDRIDTRMDVAAYLSALDKGI